MRPPPWHLYPPGWLRSRSIVLRLLGLSSHPLHKTIGNVSFSGRDVSRCDGFLTIHVESNSPIQRLRGLTRLSLLPLSSSRTPARASLSTPSSMLLVKDTVWPSQARLLLPVIAIVPLASISQSITSCQIIPIHASKQAHTTPAPAHYSAPSDPPTSQTCPLTTSALPSHAVL